MSLLESAGFSASNPYYIVKQGRVAQLAKSGDTQRLKLLEEIAGTGVYETKRKESTGLLRDTNDRLREVDRSLAYMQDRLEELRGEQQELQDFEKLDRARHAIEYALFHRELAGAEEKLQTLEDAYVSGREEIDEAYRKLAETRTALQKAEGAVAQLQQQAEALGAEREQLAAQLPSLTRARVAAAAKADEAKARAAEEASGEETIQAQLEEVEAEAAAERERLRIELRPKLEEASQARDKARTEVQEAQAEVDALYARMGRSGQFKSASKRDAWLREQVRELRAEIEARQAQIKECDDEAAAAGKRSSDAEAAVPKLEKQADKAAAAYAKASKDLDELGNKRSELLRSRLEHLKEEKDAQATVDELAKARTDADEKTLRGLPAQLRSGLLEVRRLQEEEGWEGIKGTLLELAVPTGHRFHVAAESVAGLRLFNVIVEDEAVAARCIRHLQKTRRGRVTFVPLKRLPAYEGVDAAPRSNDAVPLIERLNYEDEVEPAVAQVFGKVMLCRDAATCVKVSKMPGGWEGVTLHGDRVEKGGTMSGGFLDPETSRLSSHAALIKVREQLLQARTAQRRAADEADRLGQAALQVRQQHQELEARRARARDEAATARKGRQDAAAAVEEAGAKARAQAARAAELRTEVAGLEAQASSYEEEIGTKLQKGGSDEAKEELAGLEDRLAALREEEGKAGVRVGDLEAEVKSLEARLRENLDRRAESLRARLGVQHGGLGGEDGGDGAEGGLDGLVRESQAALEEAKAAEDAATSRLQEVESRLKEARGQLTKEQSDVGTLLEVQTTDRKELERLQEERDQVTDKRRMLERKREECANKIRDLGTVGREELEALQGKHRKALMKDLKRVNADLKKYAHVNRKAIDQHQAFAKRRDELQHRRGGMSSAAGKLEQMISLLDRRKDKALLRTFRGVAQHFAAVFSELVPRGQGRLYMRVGKRKRPSARASAAAADEGEDDEDDVEEGEGKEEEEAGSGAVERKEGESESEGEAEEDEDGGEFDLTSEGLAGLDFDDEEAARAVGEQEAASRRSGGRRRRRGMDDEDEDELEEDEDEEEEDGDGEGVAEEETSEELERVLALVPRFKGVQIKVSFNERDTPHPMQTLSGGQATLVALALIFAIQRCDPAPFYLFDEIDQALDPTHRRAVAALVQRQAHSKRRAAQFITTTFRPELVRVADRWFGIAFEHKSSRVVSYTQAQALGFVHTIMQEEDAAAQGAGKAAAGGRAASGAAAGSARKRGAVASGDAMVDDEEAMEG